MSDDGEKSAEEIHRQILRLLQQFDRQTATGMVLDAAGGVKEQAKPTRRDFVVGGTTLLAGGALIIGGAGNVAASDGSASGDVGSAANPALRVFTDTFHFHERTSDPSSPSNGTMWYNSSA